MSTAAPSSISSAIESSRPAISTEPRSLRSPCRGSSSWCGRGVGVEASVLVDGCPRLPVDGDRSQLAEEGQVGERDLDAGGGGEGCAALQFSLQVEAERQAALLLRACERVVCCLLGGGLRCGLAGGADGVAGASARLRVVPARSGRTARPGTSAAAAPRRAAAAPARSPAPPPGGACARGGLTASPPVRRRRTARPAGSPPRGCSEAGAAARTASAALPPR